MLRKSILSALLERLLVYLGTSSSVFIRYIIQVLLGVALCIFMIGTNSSVFIQYIIQVRTAIGIKNSQQYSLII